MGLQHQLFKPLTECVGPRVAVRNFLLQYLGDTSIVSDSGSCPPGLSTIPILLVARLHDLPATCFRWCILHQRIVLVLFAYEAKQLGQSLFAEEDSTFAQILANPTRIDWFSATLPRVANTR